MADSSISSTAGATSALDARAEQVVRTARSKERSQIDKSATDFESILLGQLLESAHRAFATVPGSDPNKDSDPGADNFRSIGMQTLATSIAQSGGIGIGSMLVKYLSRTASPAGSESDSAAVGAVQEDTRR
jgi:Rod binding domain-containing protein